MFVCLDLETTGLSANDDHVIEVAIVLFDNGKIIDEWSSLVKPPIPIPSFTKNLTGITDEMVTNAPTLDTLKSTILEKLGGWPIMGHFIFFDIGFLQAKGFELSNAPLDTCQLAQTLLPNEPSYSLEVLAKKLGITQDDAHRAMDDVKANIELYWQMRSHIAALSPEEKSAIKPILEKSEWTWAKPVLDALKESDGTLIEATLREKVLSSEEHVDLSKATALLPVPFLLEDPGYTYKDLLNYGLTMDAPVLMVVPNVTLFPEHEDVAIIKSPQDYVDEERLERFLAKPVLNDIDTMLGMKTKLWLQHSKTGDRAELRVVKEGKQAWYDICCQETDQNPDSTFQRMQNEAEKKKIMVISQFHFLRDRSRKTPQLTLRPHVVIGETEELGQVIDDAWHISLSESRFLEDLRRLKEENPDLAEPLDHLAGKISILFAFLGMEIKRYADPEDVYHQLLVEAHHRNTNEWNKVIQAAESIVSTLPVLSDLKKTATLDAFDRYITYLKAILSSSGPILWLTMSMDEYPIVHSFPEQTEELFKERVWKDIEKLHLFCHHGDLHDDFKFVRRELGLPEDLTVESSPSTYPIPLLETSVRISKPNEPSNIKDVSNELKNHVSHEGNLFLLVTSKHTAEQLYHTLSWVKDSGRSMFVQNLSGGMGKILQMSSETDGHNLFIGTDGFLSFLIDEGVDLKLLAVHRIPFSSSNDPIQKGRADKYENAYEGYVKPQANLRYFRLINKFLGNAWKGKAVLLLDPRKDQLL